MVPFTFSIFFQVKFFTATDGCGTGCVVTEPFDRSIGYEVAFSVSEYISAGDGMSY